MPDDHPNQPADRPGHGSRPEPATGDAGAVGEPGDAPECGAAAAADDFPETGPLLGIDYGSRRVGIAICTSTQTIASPVLNYTRQTPEVDARRLEKLVEEWQPVGLVVGLPVHMSGEEGEKARAARKFGEWAARVTGLPLRFFDERFTSLAAEARLMETGLSPAKRKARLDKIAAQVMLQGYLDSPNRTGPPADLRRDRPE